MGQCVCCLRCVALVSGGWDEGETVGYTCVHNSGGGMPTGTLERSPGLNYPAEPIIYQLFVCFFSLRKWWCKLVVALSVHSVSNF